MSKDKIVFNRIFSKSQLRDFINWFLINYGTLRTKSLLDNLKSLGFKYSTLSGISIGSEDLIIPYVKENLFISVENYIKRFDLKFKRGEIPLVSFLDKFIQSWTSISDILKDEVVLSFKQKDLLNPLYIMTLSGARGNLSQIKQLVGMRGIMSDSQGGIIELPIKSNFKQGLSITDYFISCYGARKGLVDTALKTANSGYLTRRLVFVGQNQLIKQPNCFTKDCNLILVSSLSKIKFLTLKKRLLGRVIGKEIISPETGKLLVSYGQDVCNYLIRKLINNKKFYIRSPLTCSLNLGFCQLCYGWNLASGKIVQLGESVGIIAAQSIGEPGTQLTMRTFHTGGIFSGEASENVLSPDYGVVFFSGVEKNSLRKLCTKYGEKVFLTLSSKKIFIFNKEGDVFNIVVPSNTLLFVKPGQTVFLKQLLAQINIYNDKKPSSGTIGTINPVKSKFSGLTYIFNNSLWVLSSNIINLRDFYRIFNNHLFLSSFNLRSCISDFCLRKSIKSFADLSFNNIAKISFLNSNIKKSELYFLEKSYLKQSVLSFSKKKTVKILPLKNFKINLKPGDFVLDKEIIDLNLKTSFSALILQKNKNFVLMKKASPYFVPKDSNIIVGNFSPVKRGKHLFDVKYERKKTEDIVQGLPRVEELLEAKKPSNLDKDLNNPHIKLLDKYYVYKQKYTNEIAVKKSFDFIQKFLIDKVLSVYSVQGVDISSKHMEIIVKQMTSKVLITDSSTSSFIIGEIVDFSKVKFLKSKYSFNLSYEPILVGISKLSLMSQSFISQASFQETTKVLSRSAIEGKIDWLYGLKENLVLGNIIPAGTGFRIN